jgi:hypothetical protein
LVTDFMNLKIKPAQLFGCAHRDRVCIRMFIRVSAYTCISICVFLKKESYPLNWEIEKVGILYRRFVRLRWR